MKKKLIAIVASLAMVATLVPATAFAAVTAPNDGPLAATLGEATDDDFDTTAGTLDKEYTDLLAAGYHHNLYVTPVKSGLKLTGVLPYTKLEKYSTSVKSQRSGHYVAYNINVPTVPSSKHAYLRKTGVHGLKDGTELTTTDLKPVAEQKTTMLHRLENGTSLIVDIADSSVTAKWYTKYTGTISAETADNHSMYAKIAETPVPDLSGNEIELTVDTTDLTLLTEEQTETLDAWVKKVEGIGSSGVVGTSAHKRAVTYAREAYEALPDDLKAVIAKVINNGKAKNYKNIYDTMVEAEQAIEDDAALEAIRDKIARLKPLPKKEFKDQAEIEGYFTPMDEVNKLVAGLSKKQLTALDSGSPNPKDALDDYNDEYDALIKKYVDPKYAEAEKIDLSKETLDESEIALIHELKTYVDGEYIETADIAYFKQATYDALVAALDKVEKDGASLENATIAAIADQAYTGVAIEPAVTVTDKAGKEVPADDYTVIYSNNKDAGTATVTVAAKSSSAYTGSVSTTFTITPAALTDAMVKSVANATYTGKAVTPAVTVDKGVTYEVTYKNNTAVGKATAVITGTGNYSGEITKNFIVKPAKEAISSLKAGKKSLTVAYNAQSGAKYRIVYSPAKGQAKAVNTTATKKTIKNLKAGKTYKVKVRACKTIDGTTYNGTYSTVKKVKVK